MFVRSNITLSALISAICIIYGNGASAAKIGEIDSLTSDIPTKFIDAINNQKPAALLAQRKKNEKNKRGKNRKSKIRKKKSMQGIDSETCASCASLEGFVPPQKISDAIRR